MDCPVCRQDGGKAFYLHLPEGTAHIMADTRCPECDGIGKRVARPHSGPLNVDHCPECLIRWTHHQDLAFGVALHPWGGDDGDDFSRL